MGPSASSRELIPSPSRRTCISLVDPWLAAVFEHVLRYSCCQFTHSWRPPDVYSLKLDMFTVWVYLYTMLIVGSSVLF